MRDAPRPAELPQTGATLDFHFRMSSTAWWRSVTRRSLQRILDVRARSATRPRLRITGYRSASRLSNGTVMREREDIDRERAEQIRELLRGAGLEAVKYTLHWKDLSKRPDGVRGRRQPPRRVSVDRSGARAVS